jgi:hypothetical protein
MSVTCAVEQGKVQAVSPLLTVYGVTAVVAAAAAAAPTAAAAAVVTPTLSV